MERNKRSFAQRLYVWFAILLAVAIGGSTLIPFLAQTSLTNTGQSIIPTETPAPTAPPPPTTDTITFDRTYLHPSGLFTAQIPTGWEPERSFASNSEAQAVLRNDAQQSVIEMRVLSPEVPVSTVNDLNNVFTDNWLAGSWREYSSWAEDVRAVEDDQLVINFSLTRSQQDFIARHVAYLDGGLVYVVRIVTPDNAPEALVFLQDNVLNSFAPVPQYVGTPIEWQGFYDRTDLHFIRYPRTWQISDGESGTTVTITGDNNTLSIESDATAIDSAEAASAWLQGWRSNIEITNVAPITRDGFDGFEVSYNLPSLDGPAENGAVVMINDPDGSVHVANLRGPAIGAMNTADDASADEASEEDDTSDDTMTQTFGVLDTFTLLPEYSDSVNESTVQG